MGIQGSFDQQAIDMLPLTSAAIYEADAWEGNQMQCFAIRECLNSSKALVDMTKDELKMFDSRLIAAFKYKKWI